MDRSWWAKYLDEVNETFAGARFTTAKLEGKFKTTRLELRRFRTFGNSGAGCISLALAGGARRVVLLGYDCQKTGGQTHWHGDHPHGLGNAGRMESWREKFAALAASVNGTDVINSTRETALTCFRRLDLEEALAL